MDKKKRAKALGITIKHLTAKEENNLNFAAGDFKKAKKSARPKANKKKNDPFADVEIKVKGEDGKI